MVRRLLLRLLSLVLVGGVLYAGWFLRGGGSRQGRQAHATAGVEALERAFEERRSSLWVTVTLPVTRLLPDDRKGSPHQRFLVRLPSGQTILVAHNLELAPRAPVAVGDSVEIRGEYEWNELGGVLHWTHHDPDGRREGGYLRFQGQEYR